MEKERRIKTLSVVALIVAVLGLTVAFASLSTTLTINGSATVDAAEWDIHFADLAKGTVVGASTGASAVEVGESGAKIEEGSTTISGIGLTVSKPGDSAEYTFKIVNNGTINAAVSSVTDLTLCKAGSTDVAACDWDNSGTVTDDDIANVNKYIKLTLKYTGGDAIAVDDTINAKTGNTATVQNATLKLEYVNVDETPSQKLPKKDLTFNNLTISVNYVQAD